MLNAVNKYDNMSARIDRGVIRSKVGVNLL